MSETLVIVSTDQILRRIRGEFLEMPGLRLTFAQAQRLWGLDADTCAQLLQSLTDQRFLHRRHDGTYARASEQADRLPAPRMAKASHPSSAPHGAAGARK